jgi:phosphatidylserine/phosphatidylglycerophosphate/cardiolipin synthase-like enzyme
MSSTPAPSPARQLASDTYAGVCPEGLAAIREKFQNWIPELKRESVAMVHSKVIVLDPFGEHPVLMTGSHNMGPKASAKNDDNLVIVENNPALAQAYAVNIIAIYQNYQWRLYRETHQTNEAWSHLEDTDTWQDGHLQGWQGAELAFWLGEDQPATLSRQPAAASSRGRAAATPKGKAGQKTGKPKPKPGRKA